MTSIITPEARQRCTNHSLAEQLAQLRELERQRVLSESYERILRDGDELHGRDMRVGNELP